MSKCNLVHVFHTWKKNHLLIKVCTGVCISKLK